MINDTKQTLRAGFFRRLAAMIYDLLVAVAIGMCAGLIMLICFLVLFESNIINKGGHEHFMDLMQASVVYPMILQAWVAFWVVIFFLWFWRNGGQTIGMRAWRLRLFSTNDKPFGYGRALLRLICSLGGLGTLLVLVDVKSKLSLQDRLTNTEILVLSKEANHHASWKNIQE
ncbi:MAG: RDD family protein [Paraglaciecola sp.]|uniref:RDD family protein n=2 Tax=Paraglaciecola sp. TaxID=1920173 RepID=UPI003267C89E